MKLTEEARLESYFLTNKQKRKKAIIEALGDEEMTARELTYKLGFHDCNAVKPRLTEMVKDRIIEEAGLKYDPITNRTVTTFRRRDVNV